MKAKNLLIVLLVLAMLAVTVACNERTEDVQPPDTVTEETEQTPDEENTEPEPLPELTAEEDEVNEVPIEETVYPEYETPEHEEEPTDEPEEEYEVEDEPTVETPTMPEVVVIGADVDPELIGSWISDVNEFSYIFLADGTGVRGIYPEVEEFSWHVEDGNVLLTLAQGTGPVTENWDYAVLGENLMLTRAAMPGELLMFSRSG